EKSRVNAVGFEPIEQVAQPAFEDRVGLRSRAPTVGPKYVDCPIQVNVDHIGRARPTPVWPRAGQPRTLVDPLVGGLISTRLPAWALAGSGGRQNSRSTKARNQSSRQSRPQSWRPNAPSLRSKCSTPSTR